MKTCTSLVCLALVALPLASSRAQGTAETAVAPAPAAPTPPALSPGAGEVVRLAGAGSSEEVLLAYIQNANTPFELAADQILYLRDIGVTSPVITAMLNRDSALHGQAPAYNYDQKAYPATAPPPANPAPVPASEPAPAPAAAQVSAPLTPPPGAPAPVYVSSAPQEVSYFYNDLAPYGTWVQVDNVGWCWQPRVVAINRGWRPYCDSGHWVYTDAGWFWQSDYSWGWAPFHYGRWYMHPRCGWVWWPDRVWGPAWVTWRYQGNYCGWAPLPPHADFDVHVGYRYNGAHVGVGFEFGLGAAQFTFIGMNDFHRHDFSHYRLPPAEVNRIYNHTTVVNNYVVNNNVIVNQGIQVDRVEAATHTQFRKVAIRDVPAGSTMPTRQPGSAKAEAAVYRPQLQAPPKPVNMVAQKIDDRHPVVQHAPVMTSRPERPAQTRMTQPGSVPGRPSPQGQPPGTYPRGAVDRAPAYPQPQPAPTLKKAGQPASPTAPSRTEEQPRTAPSDRQQQGRPSGYGSTPQYPVRSGSSAPPESARPAPAPQSSSSYYPKGYHQAAETYALPPANPRPSDARGQGSVAQRPQPNSSENRSSNGSSKKD
jgi:hypothetical protein